MWFPIPELTYQDINNFANPTLKESAVINELNTRSANYASLVHEVNAAADGVFLWVSLACASLIRGAGNGDNVSHLRKRLHRLLREINDMYKHMLLTVEAEYCKAAALSLSASAFEQSNDNSRTSLMWHFCLDEEEQTIFDGAIQAAAPTNAKSVKDLELLLIRRFNARSKRLLQVGTYTDYKYEACYGPGEMAVHRLCRTDVGPTTADCYQVSCNSFLKI